MHLLYVDESGSTHDPNLKYLEVLFFRITLSIMHKTGGFNGSLSSFSHGRSRSGRSSAW